ncbi:MAG: L,D-transpeptidase family protein [Candidatus Omnitrophica bacterium]|nr:L,D-transpeptidase family protein [Candidatus Omnitrophota bacterium]MCG2704966.1 L,D-transpeptidase family protein [Candidatus Omnitrophota bacterium]
MNKRIIFIAAGVIIAALFLSDIIYKRNSSIPGVFTKAQTAEVSDREASKIYNEADKLAAEGKILDALNMYKRILAEYPGSALVSQARSKLDDFSVRILFSPIPTQDSTVYEVVSGDNLTKIAKKFGTTVDLIMKSNALSGNLIRPGMKLKISKAKYSILVDKSQNILILKSDGEVFKTYIVATGINNSTPIGTYQINEKLVDPTWHKAGAVIPPGSPDNILGTRWLGLTLEHYGIHGTTDDSALGQQVTAGCVRMSNKDVEEIYCIVPVGTEVTIID